MIDTTVKKQFHFQHLLHFIIIRINEKLSETIEI